MHNSGQENHIKKKYAHIESITLISNIKQVNKGFLLCQFYCNQVQPKNYNW
jgi:hypothetical protein